MQKLICGTNETLIEQLEDREIKIDLWVADPNWPYMQTGGGDGMKFRSMAKREYSEGDYGDIADTLRRAAHVSTPDAVLALWVTAPQKIDVARRVVIPLEDWGAWKYKACAFWRKTGAPGIGQWVRNDVEELWLLSRNDRLPPHLRGHMKARTDDAAPKVPCFRNWLEAGVIDSHESPGRGKGIEHSEKPVELEQRVIERFCPPSGVVGSMWSGMFATGRACKVLGLDCYGAEPDRDRFDLAVGKLGE